MRIRTDKKGFTLIEMIVVMVLISVTAAFTLPKIQSSLYSNKLRATAQRFVGLVTEASQEARAKNTVFALRFDAQENAFLAVPVTAKAKTEEEADKVYLRAKLEDSVTLVEIETQRDGESKRTDETGIIFNTRGYTRKAIIHFKEDTGDQVSVILSPFLGVARILEDHVSLEDDRMTISR
ncbi:MAG: type II secretion system protein GspH [Candidatus Electrothrix sp. GM3_4]|nr:type II secretion system protein GspH [Candidatus Electrothrix sp. GM3_4]